MNDAEYAELETQWEPLMRKFASWSVPNMDYEDIMQEMRIVLFKSQRRFDKSKNTKLITFFYMVFLNRVLGLLRDSGSGSKPYMKYVPASMVFPLCEGGHGEGGTCENLWCTALAVQRLGQEDRRLSDLSLSQAFDGVSNDAKRLANLIIKDRWSATEVKKIMGTKRAKEGIAELKLVLRGGIS